MFLKCGLVLLVLLALGWLESPADAQSTPKRVEGLWSDPPPTAIGAFCEGACAEAGIERLNALLDDPANDARPYPQLRAEADRYQREQYLRPRLTAAALETYPVDPADDPALLRCEPFGLARQMLARHQIEIRRRGNDRVELRYGEWDARRTVFMGATHPAKLSPSRLGHSVGRWEGETLVVETAGVAAGLMRWAFKHSEQLRVVERFTRSDDGNTLQLTATFEDPWSLRQPLVLKKVWRWAPESTIAPYQDCERPAAVKREEGRRGRGAQPK